MSVWTLRFDAENTNNCSSCIPLSLASFQYYGSLSFPSLPKNKTAPETDGGPGQGCGLPNWTRTSLLKTWGLDPVSVSLDDDQSLTVVTVHSSKELQCVCVCVCVFVGG